MVIVTMDLIINDPTKRDEIVALMAELHAAHGSPKGLIRYDWYASLREPNRIRLYMEHESRETFLATEEKEQHDPAWVARMKKLFAYQQSGALTMTFENSLRRYETGAELPPFAPNL